MGIDLVGRNAFDDYERDRSVLEFSHIPVNAKVHISIVIPTYQRSTILLEAIHSSILQDYRGALEIVIVDNDPASHLEDLIKDVLLNQDKVNVKYYRNMTNIGMFGNWNRGIYLSEGEWVTVLNDDDILSPDFVSRSLAALSGIDGADGIVCQKGIVDRRNHAMPHDRQKKGLRGHIINKISSMRFSRNGLRRLTPRMLYFANYPGNTAGFLFRRRVALAIGGFLPEEWPAADYMMYVRFAIKTRIFLFKPVLAYVGLGENESMRPETLTGFVRILAQSRQALAGKEVPAHWATLDAQLVSNYLSNIEQAWGVRLDRYRIAAELGMALPEPDRLGLAWKRLLRRAF